MAHDEDYVQLGGFLREQGHSELEIEKIIVRVKHYEEDTKLYSVMDSIADGSLNLTNIINEALSESDEPNGEDEWVE